MKYFSVLFLIIVSCRTTSLNSNFQLKFEENVRSNWSAPTIARKYNFASDSLIIFLNTKYRNCIIGKDSAYIHKLFGTRYTLDIGTCFTAKPRVFGMEYQVQTPAYDGTNSGKCGYAVNLCGDSLGIIRWMDIYIYDCQGYK